MSPLIATARPAAELLAAARAGDPAAQEELVTRHLDGVEAVCRRRLSSPHDVADAVQETFLRALARLDQVREAEALAGWLHATAARVCLDHARSAHRTTCVPSTELDAAADHPGPPELAVARDEASRLHATLATLGARDRRALWLRDAIGLPVSTVAAELGLTEGSARVLLSRARTRVRAAYHGVAGLVVAGWLRFRSRLAAALPTEPAVVRTLAAAQLAVVIAVVAGAPEPGPAGVGGTGDSGPPVGAAVETPMTVVGAAVPAASGVTTSVREAAAVDRADAGAGSTDDRDRAPVVGVTNEPPAGPSDLGVGASDGDGDVATVQLWGGPFPGGDGAEDGRDDGGAEGDISVGPVDLVGGDLSSRLPGRP